MPSLGKLAQIAWGLESHHGQIPASPKSLLLRKRPRTAPGAQVQPFPSPEYIDFLHKLGVHKLTVIFLEVRPFGAIFISHSAIMWHFLPASSCAFLFKAVMMFSARSRACEMELSEAHKMCWLSGVWFLPRWVTSIDIWTLYNILCKYVCISYTISYNIIQYHNTISSKHIYIYMINEQKRTF